MQRSSKCPKCAVSLKIPASLAGKRVQCPKCQATLKIPSIQCGQTVSGSPDEAGGRSSPGKPQLAAKERKTGSGISLRDQIATALSRPIDPVRKSPIYAFAALLVTLVMLVLPLIYVALICLTCYGVYYHLTHHHGILLLSSNVRVKLFLVVVYAAPLVVGVIAIVFMIKPLFARPATRNASRSLTPHGQELLFDFVTRICDAVGAPRPARIDVDTQMNASASFRRGLLSMFGNDLVLTIGVPLVAGLSLSQFAGVLAHEFGHFSQGVGMRLSYVIRSINAWFARVVYERDEWDAWLEETMREIDFRVGWVLGIAAICVWLSRRVLWCLMMFGHFVSCLLLRQMEYDADRYEARLVGNAVFAATGYRLVELSAAHDVAHLKMFHLAQKGVYIDNVAKMSQVARDAVPPDILQQIRASADNTPTKAFDTHPSLKDRIANVMGEKSTGIFHVAGDARELFLRFDSVCQGVTWDFYRQVIGSGIQQKDLIEVKDEKDQKDQKDEKDQKDQKDIKDIKDIKDQKD